MSSNKEFWKNVIVNFHTNHFLPTTNSASFHEVATEVFFYDFFYVKFK